MSALQTQIPGMANRADMQPGVSRIEAQHMTRQQMPAVVAPPAQLPMGPTGPGPSPGGNNVPVSGFGNAFGYAGFGSTGGVRGDGNGSSAASPYRVMRSGMFPGIQPNVSDPRYGVYSAASHIRAQTPGAYPGANVPGGQWAR
jgi:hypothetical protein